MTGRKCGIHHLALPILPPTVFVLLICACGRGHRGETLSISPGASGRVAETLTKLSAAMSSLRAAKQSDLVKMADTFNQVNECCDELEGKNQRLAPPAEEWGALSPASRREILALLPGTENDAELCRDHARRGHLTNLLVQWSILEERYTRLVSLLEPPQR